MLISPSAADAIIAENLRVLPSEECPLAHAHGRVLRMAIRTDRPLPPFDRVTMDGFAVRAETLTASPARLRVVGLQAAGQPPLTLREGGIAIEVATGAVLPLGANAVVPYEATSHDKRRTVAAPAPSVAFTEFEITIPAPGDFRSGSNVHRQASDHAAGDELIPAGRRLRSAEIAVAATCGAAQVQVAARPKVAVIATGDELAEVGDRELASHHVRKSNDYALRAALALDGLTGPIERLHLRDEWPEIEAGLARALAEYDVVILTGGVSRGRFDHVPAVLAALGVEAKIGGVAQRPGKPMSFGVSPGGVPVFALPGNPVSACVCLHRYVLPALRRMAGAPAPNAEFVTLGKAVTFSPPLTYFLPVRVESRMDGSRIATPEPFNTSGDVGGLLQTDGFVELAAESNMFSPGLTVRFWRWA